MKLRFNILNFLYTALYRRIKVKQKDKLFEYYKGGLRFRKRLKNKRILYRRSGISIHSWLPSPSDVEVSKSNQESAPHTEYLMEHRSCCIYTDGIPCYRTSILVYNEYRFQLLRTITDLSGNFSPTYGNTNSYSLNRNTQILAWMLFRIYYEYCFVK